MIDTSTTAISLALTTLIMFLPHIPTSLVAHLPRLFLIYSRILCWDKFVKGSEEQQQHNADDDDQEESERASQKDINITSSWDKLDQALDDGASTAPELLHYFTFLYGLYPLNFMSYIRKPRKYLKSIDFPGADDFDIDQNLIRNRTEQFRQVHLMHPGFYTTTVEDELTDNRWIKADPSDVVIECMGLCVAVRTGLGDPGPPPTSKLPDIPGGMVRTEDIPAQKLSVWDGESTTIASQSGYVIAEQPIGSRKDSEVFHSLPSQSSQAGSPASHSRDYFDSPTLGPQALASTSSKIPAIQAIPSSSAFPRKPISRSSESSPRLDAFVQSIGNKRNSPPVSPVGNPASMVYLQREVMLLRNDLNFERYLKQQHLAHIGQLQRKNIREATAEAETQNLLNNNRTLKAKLVKANEAYGALQKENITGRNQAKKWEGELSNKVRSLREDQRTWQSEEEAVRHELERTQKDCEALRKLLVDAQSRDLHTQQNLRAIEQDLQELESLKQQIQNLRNQLRHYESRELEYERAKADQEITQTELDTANLRLQSRDVERNRSRQAYERKIAELESRLHAAENPMPGPMSPATQRALEAALNETQQKLLQLKKAHARLLHRYTELELRYQEMEGPEPSLQRSGSDVQDFALSSTAVRRSSAAGSVGHPGTSVSGSVGGYSSVSRPSRPHALSDPIFAPEDDDYVINLDQYNSLPGRAATLGSINNQGRSTANRISTTGPAQGGSIGGRNPSVATSEQEVGRSMASPSWEGDVVQSSSKSAWSVGSEGSKSDKGKIQPKSEIRIYGRGKLVLFVLYVEIIC